MQIFLSATNFSIYQTKPNDYFYFVFSFWSILLTDAIPLLEAEDVILSSEDSFELMRCVEDDGDDPKFHEKVEIFKLAVARNLARALNIEGCQADH